MRTGVFGGERRAWIQPPTRTFLFNQLLRIQDGQQSASQHRGCGLNLKSDFLYSLRQMRQAPVFTLAALATLALGIGATTAIFTLMHAVMLKSLPVADPSRLYRIGTAIECCYEGWEDNPQNDWSLFSYRLFQRLKEAAPEFEQLTAFQPFTNITSVRRSNSGEAARPMREEFVSGNYFSTLGIRAFAGRVITPADDQASASPTAVLSYRAWEQNYAGASSALGSVFSMNGQPVTIIGIAPPGFFGETLREDPPDFWLPLEMEPLVYRQNSHLRIPSSHWLYAIGRLRPGANIATLPARLTAVLHRYLLTEEDVPADLLAEFAAEIPHKRITLSPAGGGVQLMRADYETSLRLLMITCATVLLIACANVANLLLARAQVRRAQISLRVALGASRQRLIQQALTETVLLSVAGGGAGIAVAYGGASLLLALAFPRADFVPIDPSPSWPVLGFAFAVSLFTGILFGTVPAWFAAHADPVDALRGANRSTRGRTSSPQRLLVIAQAALSVVLLAGAGLLTRSLLQLQHQNFGLRVDHLLNVRFNGISDANTGPHLDAFYRALEDRLSHVADVQSASLALYSPLSGNNWDDQVVIEGRPTPKSSDKADVSWDRVSTHYFETIGQTLIRGRAFEETDVRSSQPVAVVNQSFVNKFFKHENPLGKRFGMDEAAYASSFEIVGVVQDAKYIDPGQPARPMFFLPLGQWMNYREPAMQSLEATSHLMNSAQLRVRGEQATLEAQVRKAFAELDPNITIFSYKTMHEQVAANFDQERTVAYLSGLLALLALLLAAVGLYGVTAYAVAVRTSEIGVRMALGAMPRDIVRNVLRGAFVQVAIGLVLGIPLAIAAGRLMTSRLFQVHSYDPLVLATAVGALGVCALVASMIPARRAASIDPVQAMRVE
jgi:predicted permease